ncbi:hypothetical protein ES705_22257 [subsurface metagenome]
MPGEEKGGGTGIDLEGYFAKVKVRELEQKKINDQIEEMNKKISQMGQNIEKVVLGMDGMGQGKETIQSFSPQQHWNAIKNSKFGLEDMDSIFSDRFAEKPEFRKQALGKLSDEKVIEMVKSKELDKVLTGVCKDEACRIDLTARVKEAQKGTAKKLL